MFMRSMMLALTVGIATGCLAADAAPAESTETSSVLGLFDFSCDNVIGVGVVCQNDVLIPVDIDIKDVRVLSGNELDVLSNSLNNITIGNILNHNKILNDLEVTVLEDFLNAFDIDVVKDDINVCLAVLGGLLCK